MKEIVYYATDNWKNPTKKFLNNLLKINKNLHSKVLYKIDLLKVNLLWINDIKYIKEKIYELRIKDENNIVRVFYFSNIWNKLIILDWYIKKDDKLKINVINKMISYKNDFIKRFGNKL